MTPGHEVEGYPFFSRYRVSRDRKEALREVEEFYYLIVKVRSRINAGDELAEIVRGYNPWERARVEMVHGVLMNYDLWWRPIENIHRKSSIVIRRFMVCLMWAEDHDHTIAEKICDMFPMAHDALSRCSVFDVQHDRGDCLYIAKYKTDWQRPAA